MVLQVLKEYYEAILPIDENIKFFPLLPNQTSMKMLGSLSRHKTTIQTVQLKPVGAESKLSPRTYLEKTDPVTVIKSMKVGYLATGRPRNLVPV